MIPANKINNLFSRILLLAVYGIFFTVQLTAYFHHKTGSVYRLSSQVFHAPKPVKHVPDGFSNSDTVAKKISIRLNKKFHPQSAVLYAVSAPKAPAYFFTKQPVHTYFDPFVNCSFLSEHSLRGPPAFA